MNATPTIVIDGERLTGVNPPQEIWAVIDRALKASGVQPPGPSQEAAVAAQPVPPKTN